MIKLPFPLIVEGKYDKITLENVVDTLIITTNGFSVFNDTEKCNLIRNVAARCGGIIVMTDSDSAGNMIRAHLKNIVGARAQIINVYVPSIKGKEKRKAKASKEGILGVEGVSRQIIIDALEKSGVISGDPQKSGRKITKTDMFLCGLSGSENAANLRKELLGYLDLPQNLSSNATLDILNTYFSYDEFREMIEKWQSAQTKS